MADTPNEAPAAPAESVATPNTNPTQPQDTQPQDTQPQAPSQPDMHGFTSEQLADMKKFFDNNGGFNAIKSKISNPAPAPAQVQEQKPVEPARPAEPAVAPYMPPEGAITQQEIFAKTYFDSLASQEKYAGISKEISSGAVLKEMAELGIRVMNPDGSINAGTVTKYLDRIAQTVPAKQSGAEPEASAAPTVDYVPVGENIKTADEARQVIMQDTQLRARGMAGHPAAQKAEEFLRNLLSKGSK